MTKRLAGGRFAIYWYRHRGGPLLMKFDGATVAAAHASEAEGVQAIAAAYSAPHVRAAPAVMTIRDVVSRYRSAPDGFGRLAASTAKQWTFWLDEIVNEFGSLPTHALKAKGVRSAFIAWRDKRSATPRSADYGMQVLKRVLSFAVDRELIERNPAEGIGNLYQSSRADIVVEEHELNGILANVTKEAASAIRLAAATGMRRGDLIALKWANVSETSIEFGTGKSRGRSRPIVPLTDEALAVIKQLQEDRAALIAAGEIPSAFVLTTRHKTPWSKDGLTQAFIRGAKAAGVDKNLHDLRGTAVTKLVLAGLSDPVIAELIGWEPTRVAQVRKRYVGREAIAKGVMAQLEEARNTG